MERELRDQLVTSIPKEDFEMLNTKVKVIIGLSHKIKVGYSLISRP